MSFDLIEQKIEQFINMAWIIYMIRMSSYEHNVIKNQYEIQFCAAVYSYHMRICYCTDRKYRTDLWNKKLHNVNGQNF